VPFRDFLVLLNDLIIEKNENLATHTTFFLKNPLITQHQILDIAKGETVGRPFNNFPSRFHEIPQNCYKILQISHILEIFFLLYFLRKISQICYQSWYGILPCIRNEYYWLFCIVRNYAYFL